MSVNKGLTRIDDAVIPDEIPRFSQITGGATGQTFARVVKKVDQIVNNSSVLQDDDELLVALSANKTYFCQLQFFYESGATPDFKYNFSTPAGASGTIIDATWRSDEDVLTKTLGTNMVHAMASGIKTTCVYFNVNMAGTAGNLIFQWAQNTANASDTTVFQGSCMIVWEELA